MAMSTARSRVSAASSRSPVLVRRGPGRSTRRSRARSPCLSPQPGGLFGARRPASMSPDANECIATPSSRRAPCSSSSPRVSSARPSHRVASSFAPTVPQNQTSAATRRTPIIRSPVVKQSSRATRTLGITPRSSASTESPSITRWWASKLRRTQPASRPCASGRPLRRPTRRRAARRRRLEGSRAAGSCPRRRGRRATGRRPS